MEHCSSTTVIRACVLAAGTSSRFGASKLVQHFRGKPLLQHALFAAQGACPARVTLVVGNDEDAVTKVSAGLCDSVAVNPDYKQGIGSSIATGVRACMKDADAILILLADQPLVTAAHLRDIVGTWSGADTQIIATSAGSVVCPPILFPKTAFDTLSELTGDAGAKQILANDAYQVRLVEFPPASLDVDTPEELQGLDQD